MNGEHAELRDERPAMLEQFQHSTLVMALRSALELLKRRLPEADTSIAWEDGEVDSDREARG